MPLNKGRDIWAILYCPGSEYRSYAVESSCHPPAAGCRVSSTIQPSNNPRTLSLAGTREFPASRMFRVPFLPAFMLLSRWNYFLTLRPMLNLIFGAAGGREPQCDTFTPGWTLPAGLKMHAAGFSPSERRSRDVLDRAKNTGGCCVWRLDNRSSLPSENTVSTGIGRYRLVSYSLENEKLRQFETARYLSIPELAAPASAPLLHTQTIQALTGASRLRTSSNVPSLGSHRSRSAMSCREAALKFDVYTWVRSSGRRGRDVKADHVRQRETRYYLRCRTTGTVYGDAQNTIKS
ncbi:hypothetical protein B0H17DRAFT_1126953 [Mycena rosella]|uniref:Uncharacterized protein n=1 Tax=Mycena rosella TaxID=1033263 RepID=A0AAD7M6P8_MYCRO|nr:hypothetical protein B0H17DRAFT_1126953 [Mycena rosella]